jgi:L-ascorbate metabolism protein UlaG (beta-lactamase superfamily)
MKVGINMRKNIWFFVMLLSVFISVQILYGGEKKMTTNEMVDNIHWFGQAAIKIDAQGKVIYIDPYRIKKNDRADIILITHEHQDHLSKADISKIVNENTILAAPETCKNAVQNVAPGKVVLLKPGMSDTIDGIQVEAVPAYNIKKTNFHPKSNQWLGYILTINGVRIYHAGDTERVPEMKNFNCDIALLPLGQTYTMNSVKDAAESALDVKAKIAIPIHYGLYEGAAEDAKTFKNILAGKIDVILMKEE